MEFFDKKEEVLDINLTAYGRHLLSMGRFKPFYYSFHDGDIIYNSEFCGFGERQSETQDRILAAHRTKIQTCFEGAETRISKAVNLKDAGYNNSDLFKYVDSSVLEDAALALSTFQSTETKHYSLGSRLGKSKLGSKFAPAWNVAFVDG